MESDRLFLGMNTATGQAVAITDEQRSTHMHVVGATGAGKSKFMEHLLQQDILAGNGVCLIDPHGYLYQDILKFLVETRYPTDKIILIDPASNDYAVGFNPLKARGKDLSYHVDAMVRACACVWGGEDTDKTPRLKRCLRMVFHALAEQGMTLLETEYLTDPADRDARAYFVDQVADRFMRRQWSYLNQEKITVSQFYEQMESTVNRLTEFLAAERLRRMLGQRDRTLDFRAIMDEGYIVLANLSRGRSVSHDNAQLLGSLLINDLFLAATERPPHSRPFYVVIDECGLFINQDIGRILDEGRKFGLHLVLAHQHLAQLKKAGEDVYQSVMTNAKTKVVFGGLAPEEAKILGELMFASEFDLNEVKHVLDRPTVVGHILRIVNHYARGVSEGKVESQYSGETQGEGRGEVLGMGTSSGSITYPGATPFSMDAALSQGEMSSSAASTMKMRGFSEGQSVAYTESESVSQGVSETLEPVLEDRPTALIGLEEHLFGAMRTLMDQPSRFAVLKLPGQFTKKIQVPFVRGFPEAVEVDDAVAYYVERCNTRCFFSKRVDEAQAEITNRTQQIEENIKASLNLPPPKTEDFRQELPKTEIET